MTTQNDPAKKNRVLPVSVQTVSLKNAYNQLGIKDFPDAPLTDESNPNVENYFSLGTDDNGREHTLEITTRPDHVVEIKDVYYNGNKFYPKTAIRLVGKIVYPNTFRLDDVFLKEAGTERFDHIDSPSPAMAQALFTAFNTARETGHAVGTLENRLPNLRKIGYNI